MEFTSTHQPAAGPSTRAPAWHPSDSSQYGSGKRALSDGEGEGGESEEDDGKPGDELPKKRRRRQALSCTECKRRKIKCDRQHPCGPCVRRTEADKCHWNVVEPSDKYVLRTEWDGLQRRVEALERGKSEAGSYRRGDVAAGRGRSLEAREPNLDLARATGRSPSQTQIQPTIQDITTTRIARLEAFLATISPDAWARFQAEEVNQVAGLDEHGRRDEEKHSTARSHHMDWRPPRSEDGHSSVSMGSAWPGLSVRAPRSEPSVSPLIPTRREGGHSPFQSSSVHAPPHPHLHGQSSQHSPLPAHSISHSPATHSQEQYARPLLPRGPSDQFPTAPSVSHFPGRSLDGPLPGPRSLGIVPGFGGPKGEGTMSSRPMNESWDAHLSSRVLPPPLPSPRSRGSGASASSTVFSDRRPSDPSPLGKYDTLGGKGDYLNVKHIEPGSKHDREDDSGPPQVFLSFPMPNNSSERATLLASVLGKSETELEAGAIPSRSVCDKIVSFYFQRVSWNHNLIDPEAFHRSYDDFFHSPSEKRHAPFIALLLAILCVGLGNMTPERATREGICKDLEHWKQRCDAYWRACQRALSANDVAQKKPIELAQTLVMLLYCNQSLDGNGWEYSAHFVAFAVRIAHSMGLSKLGSEPVGQVPPPGLRERELRRRVWWNIVFMDWYLSPMVGHSYLIHPAQCNTAHPANLNWDEMVDGRRFEPMDRNQWTESAFLIAKAEVAESVRELSDHINAGQALTRDFLLAYERRLNERLGLVATSLIQRDHLLERDDRVAWERIMFTFGLNNRAIRLHRRYMLRGYAVLEYRGSTEKCINAAKNTLHTYQEAQSIDFPGVTWWVVCMHSFAAAVILLMDQFYARTAIGGEMPTPAEMETRRRHIHQATRLLATVGEVNDLAMRCAHVLDILLDEVTRKRDAFAPPDVHPSPYTHLPPVEIGRLASATCHPTDADLTRWVATGLGSLSVPDGELQSAPVGARGLSAEVEKFWTRVFELDFPMNSPE